MQRSGRLAVECLNDVAGKGRDRHRLQVQRPLQLQPGKGKQVLDQADEAATFFGHAADKVEGVLS